MCQIQEEKTVQVITLDIPEECLEEDELEITCNRNISQSRRMISSTDDLTIMGEIHSIGDVKILSRHALTKGDDLSIKFVHGLYVKQRDITEVHKVHTYRRIKQECTDLRDKIIAEIQRRNPEREVMWASNH